MYRVAAVGNVRIRRILITASFAKSGRRASLASLAQCATGARRTPIVHTSKCKRASVLYETRNPCEFWYKNARTAVDDLAIAAPGALPSAAVADAGRGVTMMASRRARHAVSLRSFRAMRGWLGSGLGRSDCVATWHLVLSSQSVHEPGNNFALLGQEKRPRAGDSRIN
jgi:hypothetical protein